MEKEIECFIHDHPLILRDHTHQVEKVKYCSVCELPISSTPMYDCNQCKDFFIHKSCAELPQQMEHPFHPQHPLTLFCKSPYESGTFVCDACGKKCASGFGFHCEECNFDLDVGCTSLQPTIRYEGHEHPLTLFDLISKERNRCAFCDHFVCEAYMCLAHKEDGSVAAVAVFCCKECNFKMQEKGASLQPTIRYEGHENPLPLFDLINKERNRCDSCFMACDAFVFRCVECNFNLHPHCFPWLPHTVKHKCHLHPLTLTENVFEEGDDFDELYCDACEEKRDPKHPVYYCEECQFIAHIDCVMDEVLPSIITVQEGNPKSEVGEIGVTQIIKNSAKLGWETGLMMLKIGEEIDAMMTKLGKMSLEIGAMAKKIEARIKEVEVMRTRFAKLNYRVQDVKT